MEFETSDADLKTEIRRYPGPIAGCDVQFQRLLDERGDIIRGLGRMDKAV